jgi:NADPH:quinone reductase-like Zn-dependent oxidoreductase
MSSPAQPSGTGFRAVVVEQPGDPGALKLSFLERRPLEETEVRLRVEASGANPVDAGNRADPRWAGIAAPYVVGYECSGTVIEAGARVDDLAEGDEVWALLPVRGTRWGTYAEEVVADAHLVARRPAGLTPFEAAALPLAGATALQLIERLDPAPGEWVLVHGAAGGVGHLFVQVARSRGARIAAPASEARHELLRSLGVEVIVDRRRPDALEQARGRAGTAFAVCADFVGRQLLPASLPFLADGARVGSIVELTGDYEEAVDRNMTLHGVLVRPGRGSLEALAQTVENGGLRPHIADVVPLQECRRVHERLETGSGQGKIVLVVGSDSWDGAAGSSRA